MWDYGYNDETGLYDLNKVRADTLARETHIEPKKAEWIIRYRQQNGPFASVGDVINVPLGRNAKDIVQILAMYVEVPPVAQKPTSPAVERMKRSRSYK